MNTHHLRLVVSSLVAVFTVLAMSAGIASAHAQYGSSTPAANATVSDAPTTVQVSYTEELSNINIQITGPDGSNVTTGPATFDLSHRTNASVPMKGVGPGLYTVVWHNVSGDDGDPNDGSFVFTVAGAAPAPAPAAAPANAAPAANPPAAAPNAAPAPAAPAPTCIDNGQRTPGINDVRVDTYCKRQAIRDKFKGQIDEATFNAALADGEGLESAVADAMADFQQEHKGH
jgi:methionine-rich copper-binding protein CopC